MPRVVLAMGPGVRSMIIDETAAQRLRGLGADPEVVIGDFADALHHKAMATAEVLFTAWGCPPLTAEALKRMPELRAIVHAAGSVKGHITDACWSRGIAVTSAAGANALPVAEYTLAAILFAGKRVHAIAAHYRQDRKRQAWGRLFPSWGNNGLTVGVVGASRIGRRVVELLRPFDMRTLVHDPHLTEPIPGTTLVSLDTLTAQSDVISIHAPELPETHHMFDRRRLALMKDGATLINTARGALVDTAALIDELRSGRIDAVLDVTEPELLPASSPLFELSNVLLTPHIAGSFGNELSRMVGAALDELERFAAGLPFAQAVQQETLPHSA